MSEYMVAGVELESPLLNAAGSINGPSVDNILREVRTLADTPLGAITIGSVPIPRRLGNIDIYGSPVYYYDNKTLKTYNSMGLPSLGINGLLNHSRAILSAAGDKPVIYSVSPVSQPGEDYGTSVEQAVSLAKSCMGALLLRDNSLIEINVSCPNIVTEGGRKPIMGYDLETMEELVDSLVGELYGGVPLGLKLPPYISDEEKAQVPELAKILRSKKVFSFIVTANTIPNQVPVDKDGNQILSVPEGKGGMSGPATKDVGREQLKLWREHLPEMDIISALGVDSGEEIKVRRDLGAVAAEGVTFLWQSTDWKSKITDMLLDFA